MNLRRSVLGSLGLAFVCGLLSQAATPDNPTAGKPADTNAAVAEAVSPSVNAGAALTKPDNGNPFLRLTLRNAFGIKPPPPEPPAVPTVVSNPPVQLPIFVTGFSLLKGVKKVYLVVNRPGAKAPDYVTAKEGEEFDGFQVVSIDPKKKTVSVLNAGVEATLDFDKNGMKPAAGAPAPGNPNVPTPIPTPRGGGVVGAGGGPTVVGRGHGGSGVITGGATPDAGTPMEIRGRGSVITGGGDATVSGTPIYNPTPNQPNAPVPVPRTRPAPPPPPLPQ